MYTSSQIHDEEITAVLYIPKDNQLKNDILATGSADNSIRLWNFANKSRLQNLIGHVADVRVLAFNAQKYHLFSGSDYSTIKVWDIHTF